MSKARDLDLEVIVPVLDDLEGAIRTLYALRVQRDVGARASVTVIAASGMLDALRDAARSDRRVTVLEADAVSSGGVLQEALSHSRADLIAVVYPGEVLSRGGLDAMVSALRDDSAADVACVQSRPAGHLHDLYPVAAQVSDWPERNVAYDVREQWWMARASFRGTVVRRSALPESIDPSLDATDAEREALLHVLFANSRVLFVAGEHVSFHNCDEYMPRLYPAAKELSWYREPIEVLWPRWMRACTDERGVAPFAQALALSAIAARFAANWGNLDKQLLRDSELEGFFDSCADLLAFVEDGMILSPFSARVPALDAALALTLYLIKRRGAEVAYSIESGERTADHGRQQRGLAVDGHLLEYAADQEVQVALFDWDAVSGELIVDGRVNGLAWLAGATYRARLAVTGRDGKVRGEEVPLEPRGWYSLTKYFGITATKSYAFRARVPIPAAYSSLELTFVCDADPGAMGTSFSGHYSRMGRFPRRSWWAFGRNYMFYRHRRITIRPRSVWGMLTCEAVMLASLMQGSGREHRHSYHRKAALLRIAYWITRPFYGRKPRWFFVDKVYKAGDSAEYLFRYASSRDDGIVKEYAIDESSPDYARLVADGYRPLKVGTVRHLLSFLNADLVFASNSAVCSLNGLKSWRSSPYKGLISFDTVCVQHGLSVQNIAVAQNRLVDNTRLYLLASHVEKENLSKPIYAYDDYPDALRLTGIPRYDGLVPDDQRQILIHPTWRMQFATPVLTHEGETRPYNPSFKDSPYFKVYASLISNQQLIACARETGYSIKYVLHPIASSQVGDFPRSESVEIIGASGALDYEEVLSQSSLMVTDYSGVQFDFAYMRKPIVYYHPPQLPPHYTEGMFSYATMAFGEISEDEQHLVDLMCDYMRGGCHMKPGFSQRVDDFFEFDDRRNCERSYAAARDYMRVRKERR